MNEITKQQKVLRLRGDIHFYLDEEEAGYMKTLLNASDLPKFIELQGRLISTNEIVGIFDPSDLEAIQRRKSGQWKDKSGNWHDRGERICPKCETVLPERMTCGTCRG